MFQKQLSSGNMIQFKSMSLLLEKTKADLVPDFEKYAIMCGDLRENFSKRFQDLNCRKTQIICFKDHLVWMLNILMTLTLNWNFWT